MEEPSETVLNPIKREARKLAREPEKAKIAYRITVKFLMTYEGEGAAPAT